ncbi:MAG TPA: D-amino acid dehydrogenase [Geminicoccus sp.]|jgi:D-amino-acid dehydrogenase|uniref:D-amino acid dehydrogenase n=1 Tax=Geminicoccus sp. TaxID=2024832 RepID=UPI002E2EC4C3|nr:D-amino acid dehydrogenase [Geminicoccus sp.]HEX2528067.1 D-amino acid dehydrogenase [Geminicoccus sp.]
MRIVVLGGGVIGAASAYWLMRDGHQVDLVERREAAGLETSWGNGAVIHVSSVEPWSAPGVPLQVMRWIGKEEAPFLLRLGALPHMWRWGLSFLLNCSPTRHRENAKANLELALLSARSMAEIREHTGIQYDYARACVMKTFTSSVSLAAATAAHHAMSPFGLVTETLDVAACVEREPALAAAKDRLAGGLYFPQDEIGDCPKFSQGLTAWCAERGANLHFGTTVEKVELTNNRVTGVLTSKGRLAADAVVVALGSFSPLLLREFGLKLPIYPIKGVSLTAPRRLWEGAVSNAVLDDAGHYALTPVGDRLRAVGTAEISNYDATPDPARIKALVDAVCILFPAFRDVARSPEAVSWAGLRPYMPDGRPLVGGTAVTGLYLNTGHGHTGWTMAAGSGRRLAEIVRGEHITDSLPTAA